VHQHRRRVQFQLLEHVLSFVEIDQSEEELVRVLLLVAERIGHDLVLFKGVLADRTLPFG